MGKQLEVSIEKPSPKKRNTQARELTPSRGRKRGIANDLSEEALRESEEKYRTVVNSANDGIAIIQDQVIQFANPRLAEMGGYEPEEIVNRPFADFLGHNELEGGRTIHSGRMNGESVPSKYELLLHGKNGDFLFVEVNSSLISYRNRPAVLIIIRDSTERKRTEKLKDSIFRISYAVFCLKKKELRHT